MVRVFIQPVVSSVVPPPVLQANPRRKGRHSHRVRLFYLQPRSSLVVCRRPFPPHTARRTTTLPVRTPSISLSQTHLRELGSPVSCSVSVSDWERVENGVVENLVSGSANTTKRYKKRQHASVSKTRQQQQQQQQQQLPVRTFSSSQSKLRAVHSSQPVDSDDRTALQAKRARAARTT